MGEFCFFFFIEPNMDCLQIRQSASIPLLLESIGALAFHHSSLLKLNVFVFYIYKGIA